MRNNSRHRSGVGTDENLIRMTDQGKVLTIQINLGSRTLNQKMIRINTDREKCDPLGVIHDP